jgi:DNA-binding transcriptional regulator PaaX
MADKDITYEDLMGELLNAIGAVKRPDPADGWVRLGDMIIKAQQERGITDAQVRLALSKEYKSGLLERCTFGRDVYYRRKG